MKLSTRTRYGMRAVIELANSRKAGPVQLRVISERQDISIKYLEQLIAVLKSAGIVRSIRGAKGGYVLAKPPNKTKLSEIFTALEGPFTTVECVVNENYCERIADCAARQVWLKVQDAVMDTLRSITLQDLVDSTKGKKTLEYSI